MHIHVNTGARILVQITRTGAITTVIPPDLENDSWWWSYRNRQTDKLREKWSPV